MIPIIRNPIPKIIPLRIAVMPGHKQPKLTRMQIICKGLHCLVGKAVLRSTLLIPEEWHIEI